MWAQRMCVVGLAVAAIGAAAEAGIDPFVGSWTHRKEYIAGHFETTHLTLLPDGRWFRRQDYDEPGKPETGQGQLDGGTLVLKDQDGTALFRARLDGAHLVVKNIIDKEAVFDKVPGSERAVIEEAREADLARLKENAAWAARFPVGPAQAGVEMPVGGRPRDTNPQRVVEQATVFTERQTYMRYWSFGVTYQVVEGPDPGNGQSQTHWHFLPNGRALFWSIQYSGLVTPQRIARAAKVTVTSLWGAYTVCPTGEGGPDVVFMRTDQGEKILMLLTLGRRRLQNGTTLYDNTHWDGQPLPGGPPKQ